MAILTVQRTLPSGERFGYVMYHLKNLLISAGWTVVGSSNATTGGMDGVDRITSGVVPNNGWIALQSPHSAPADRIQLVFQRLNASGYSGSGGAVFYTPQADLTGSGTTLPTSPYTVTVVNGYFNDGTSIATLTALADNQAPYGFALQTMLYNNSTAPADIGIALIPLSVVHPLQPGKPYVVYASAVSNSSTSAYRSATTVSYYTANTIGRCVAEPPQPPQVPVNTPALMLYQNTTKLVPFGLSVTTENRVQTHPITFANHSSFIGTSTFARWLGSITPELTTFEENGTPLARISFGELTFPWDGVTSPVY